MDALVARAGAALATTPGGRRSLAGRARAYGEARGRRWSERAGTIRISTASIACAAICFHRRRRRRPIRSTRSSCSRRPAKGVSAWRSRAACCARRAAASPSIGWRSRCARLSTTPVCSSTRSNARAFPRISSGARGGPTPRAARFSRCCAARSTICPRAASPSTCRSARCRTARPPSPRRVPDFERRSVRGVGERAGREAHRRRRARRRQRD